MTSRRVLPIGYSNGMIGYLVTAEQIAEGGYEPAESYAYLYRPGPFRPEVERAVSDHVRTLLASTAHEA